MNVSEYLLARQSVRHFEERDVSQDVLNALIETALQSPSGSNTQPYRLAVATGAIKDKLKVELSEKFDTANRIKKLPLPLKVYRGITSDILPDGPFKPEKVQYDKELFERKFNCGMGLYDTLGIAREDRQARTQQMHKNFEFFDAPAVIFVFANQGLGAYAPLDAGIFLQSLMLSALDLGLGTCVQATLGIWERPLKKYFQFENNYGLLCGVSLGYPSSHKVNSFRPNKRALQDVLLKER